MFNLQCRPLLDNQVHGINNLGPPIYIYIYERINLKVLRQRQGNEYMDVET
jgi:hypothetical protein